MKICAAVLILFFGIVNLAHGKLYDYIIQGQVENVMYAAELSNNWPCHIAVNDPESGWNNVYHAGRSFATCEFAERAMEIRRPVRVFGRHDAHPGWLTGVVGIEYAGTNATFKRGDRYDKFNV